MSSRHFRVRPAIYTTLIRTVEFNFQYNQPLLHCTAFKDSPTFLMSASMTVASLIVLPGASTFVESLMNSDTFSLPAGDPGDHKMAVVAVNISPLHMQNTVFKDTQSTPLALGEAAQGTFSTVTHNKGAHHTHQACRRCSGQTALHPRASRRSSSHLWERVRSAGLRGRGGE